MTLKSYNKLIIFWYYDFTGDDDAGDDNDDEEREPSSPSCGDYVMHFITVFWKILFAFIPPTGKI